MPSEHAGMNPHGHSVMGKDERDCEKIFEEYYYGKPSGQNKQKG